MCRFRPSIWLNNLLQPSHFNLCSGKKSWTRAMCLRYVDKCRKDLSHLEQAMDLDSSLCISLCIRSPCRVDKAWPHVSQIKALTFSWTALIWSRRSLRAENRFPQALQWCFLIFRWTASACFFKFFLSDTILPQIGHSTLVSACTTILLSRERKDSHTCLTQFLIWFHTKKDVLHLTLVKYWIAH